MIRFIELGNQIFPLGDDIEEKYFAWWTTITDEFIEFGGEQAWETWKEFEDYYLGDKEEGLIPGTWPLDRFWGLYPNYRKKREGILGKRYG